MRLFTHHMEFLMMDAALEHPERMLKEIAHDVLCNQMSGYFGKRK